MAAPVLGVIGGSGIYEIPGLERIRETRIDTPFGLPSDTVLRGVLDEVELVFLPRHGRGHGIAPHAINYRANVCAMKLLGVTHLVSLSAVGSLRENIAPGDIVVVDQYIDFTKRRTSTFFDEGIVAHVAFAEPTCPVLSGAAAAAAERAGRRVHRGGTYLCIEGPQFSTRAESFLYRSFGASVIGMTAMPEAKLAREAELPYSTVAFATDYDAWHDTEAAVSVDAVLAVLRQNADVAKRIVVELARSVPTGDSPAHGALRHAVITSKTHIDAAARSRLGWLIGPYLEN